MDPLYVVMHLIVFVNILSSITVTNFTIKSIHPALSLLALPLTLNASPTQLLPRPPCLQSHRLLLVLLQVLLLPRLLALSQRPMLLLLCL